MAPKYFFKRRIQIKRICLLQNFCTKTLQLITIHKTCVTSIAKCKNVLQEKGMTHIHIGKTPRVRACPVGNFPIKIDFKKIYIVIKNKF